MDFGRALRYIRKARKLTQVQLAEKAGTTQWLITRTENTGQRPPLDVFLNICKALNVAPSDFYILAIEDLDFPFSAREKYRVIYPHIQAMIKELIKK